MKATSLEKELEIVSALCEAYWNARMIEGRAKDDSVKLAWSRLRDFCADCELDTRSWFERYMLLDSIWEKIAPTMDGSLCVDCAESRLGRRLATEDFRPGPLTAMSAAHSAKLASRLYETHSQSNLDKSPRRVESHDQGAHQFAPLDARSAAESVRTLRAQTVESEGVFSPENTLAYIDEDIRKTAEVHMLSFTCVWLSAVRHSDDGVEYATQKLRSRGFSVTVQSDSDCYMINIRW